MSTKHSIKRFNTIREYADKAAEGVAQSRQRGERCVATYEKGQYDDDWFGTTKTFEEAYDLAVNGWEAGYREIRATMDKVMPRVREKIDPAPVLVPEHFGDLWDIGEYVSGNPEYAWNEVYEENQAQARVVSVLVGGALVWMVDPQDVLHRGSLVLSCMEAIELLGHQMEVWAEVTVQAMDYESVSSWLVRAKAAGEPVDMRSYAFTCDPGWHRRLGFAFQHTWPKDKRSNFGVGTTYSMPKGPRCDKIVGASLVFDLGTPHGWPSRTATEEVQRDWVIDTLGSLESKLKIGYQGVEP